MSFQKYNYSNKFSSLSKIEKMDSNKLKPVFETNLCIPNYDNVLHKLMEVNNMEKCVNVVKQLMKDKNCDKNEDHEFVIVKKKKKSKDSSKKSKDSLLNVIYY